MKKDNQNSYVVDFFKELDISQNQISEDLGVSQPYVSALVNGKKDIGKKMAKKIASIYGADEARLLLDKGEMLTSEIEESQTEEIDDKVLISDVVSYKKSVGKPYYDIDFINGFKDVVEITNENPDYNINYPPAEACDFWANATGYSMQGHINHGDTIAFKKVDTRWFPLGEIYGIVTTNGHRMIKRISESKNPDCYRLISSNPDKNKYPDQDIPKDMIRHLYKIICAIKIIN